MTFAGTDNTDIMLDADGQPMAGRNGDFQTVSGTDCWKQDLMLEAQTDEGELFYEDETGHDRYGFGLTDFVHAELDDFREMEIRQRIKAKLDRRSYLDQRKTKQTITFRDGDFADHVTVCGQDPQDTYNMIITKDSVEVLI